jgi:hypothetical protein
MTAKMPGLQRHLRIDNDNIIATRATTPAQQQEDAFVLMMAMTPLLQGHHYQLDDYACSTTAEIASQQGQQLPLQRQQRCLRINGNNAITTRTTTPLQ